MKISIFLITYNEETQIERTLNTLKWADEIVVVDGGSNDRTAEICKRFPVFFYTRKFDSFDCQKNYALSKTSNEWVLSIDADEIVSPELSKEILEVINENRPDDGFTVLRQNIFLNRPLRFGGQGMERVLRLFRKSKGKFWGHVHETVHIDGPVGHLSGVLIHNSIPTLKEYYRKLVLYTDMESVSVVEENRVPNFIMALLGPPIKFVLNYVIKGGFLDNKEGFLYHALSCCYGWIRNFKAYRLLIRKRKKH
ncbi:MAG: hypothetical protein A3G33_06855 [Omnitrophica bacterium RIFCSPLOWO2_12_FULL_44_17]|uniref:Glycosyltransferase 2-like domain-containing protein n=1 Tax=Candidatus Danuiimicrobium aquiferis TaxID=1801832 RepID=A0A1G1KYG6_9BACT|nr:MAG: hypothetical protein A3B72_07150 [Omnitrophica bacterium RIFCSPHIGHO2_02_FULL_45_28]OGW88387.1 MAG: hypothetical protein A3E74_05805 [Omnitrophica bacterium RIFCSPHIGHO2_12_FULL_44_12]OGW97950.1 MAG: hypothetical protein A3G33_06855 [Omnitrophica bacterium RIFCSPLOWO2_12_FULL_44_17]OGX04219.1 MAG: hypothetical protein A3J12_11575 [Omnitrophica bacterium RIFCSPLOWO2_02_FULL_44_11]